MLFRYRVPKSRTLYKENQKFLNFYKYEIGTSWSICLHVNASEFQFGGFKKKKEGMLHYDISTKKNHLGRSKI